MSKTTNAMKKKTDLQLTCLWIFGTDDPAEVFARAKKRWHTCVTPKTHREMLAAARNRETSPIYPEPGTPEHTEAGRWQGATS